MNNIGLIITASDLITESMGSDKKKELKNEYARRAYNRQCIEGLFMRNCITPVVLKDVSRKCLEESIQQFFGNADSNSMSYIYINCHGNVDGLYMVINGTETTAVSFSDLRTMLDTIQGTKVVMIESCQSGASITATSGRRSLQRKQTPASQMNEAVINAFSEHRGNKMLRRGELRGNNYLVITACHENESAWGSSDNKGNDFTKMWCEGAGWDHKSNQPIERRADTNLDGFVTLGELCRYTQRQCIKKGKEYQDDMCFPEDSARYVFGDMPLRNVSEYDTSENSAIEEYYLQHGGSNGDFGLAISPLQKINGIAYQNFMGGVIVQYENGMVAGHTKLRYTLNRLKQIGKISDGKNDNSLEMFVIVHMKQDGIWIEKRKRWPEYSKHRHGGTNLNIIYEGKTVTDEHPQNANVFYDSLIMRGESKIYLEIEVWDYDRSNANDHIRTYHFDLNLENGWGIDKPIQNPYASRETTESSANYDGVYEGDDKIILSFSVENL
ncbi:MAG: hypothetical protein AUK64_2156 [bacterium P201]|nr:MAG: hypothetical protein AUK64_2156 [bacterium P201]